MACFILDAVSRDPPYRSFIARNIPNTHSIVHAHLQTALTVCRCAKFVGAFHVAGISLRKAIQYFSLDHTNVSQRHSS